MMNAQAIPTGTVLDLSVIDFAHAYDCLPTALQAQLQAAFDGQLNLSQTYQLAARMLKDVDVVDMAFVLARLIVLSSEGGGKVDIDLTALEREAEEDAAEEQAFEERKSASIGTTEAEKVFIGVWLDEVQAAATTR